MGGYILSNQRFYLPGWVPVLGTDFFELKGEFATAQSVTPGQGQTVDIAGVPVGEIKRVELEDGRAIVTMSIRQKYADMIKQRRDHAAAAQDRPQGHGHRDGPGHAGRCRRSTDGYTVPVSQTEPDVNLDEILAGLDRDTRDYLRLLVAGGGEGLKDNGRRLRNTFRRFEPLNRDVAKLTGELSPSGARTSRTLIHNLQLLVTEVGTQGQGARRAGRVPERRLRGVRQPGRATCARRSSCCPARSRRPTTRSTSPTS